MIHHIEQNTDEWFNLRMGRITASNFGTIMANYGKAFGNPAIQYAMRTAIESKTKRMIETFQNEWMARGTELEQDAREAYEMQTFRTVLPGGFCERDGFGASSDGLADEGMIEIKCPKYSTHFSTLLSESYDTTYQWQIRGQMWLYDRPWCDFVSYCPEMPESKQLLIYRVDRDQELEDRMVKRLIEFRELVKTYINALER